MRFFIEVVLSVGIIAGPDIFVKGLCGIGFGMLLLVSPERAEDGNSAKRGVASRIVGALLIVIGVTVMLYGNQ